MNFSRLFIQRPVATTLLMAALFLAGVMGYRALPVSALPEVDYPTIQVSAFYPGASPDVMTSAVTAPLERQFGQMPGLAQMSSTSSGGSSVITLQFDLALPLDVAEQEVQAGINAAGGFLPKDLPNPPVYSKVNPADAPILSLAVTSDALPLPEMADKVDMLLAQKLSQVSGVGLVSLSGGQRKAVRIRVNPDKLAARGIDLETLRASINAANTNLAKGSFDGPHQSSNIDANDQIRSAAGYRDVVVAYRDGAPVRLSDLGQADDGAENIYLSAWAGHAGKGQKPGVIVNVQRQPGANVIAVVDRIRAILPQLKAALPPSVHLEVLADRTTTIRASVEDVEFELMLSVGLVVLVIFIFLRNLPATVIPGIAVPLSLVGTFGVMSLVGFSVNNLTLMALTIATGFVVDDAIVMIENIARYIEGGDSPMEAALKGSKQIGFTIVSLTISLIAVLIPLLFMADVVGRLFREFAVTLAVSILISAVVSLTLTPMMCARFLRHIPPEKEGAFHRASGRFFDGVIALYDRILRWVLRHQKLTLAVAVATLALTADLYTRIPKGFFPQQDTGVLLGITEGAEDSSFAAMAKNQEAMADAVLEDPDVESVSSFIGVDGVNAAINLGRLSVNLKPLDRRKSGAAAITERIKRNAAKVPGIVLHLQPVQDITIDTAVSRGQYQFLLQTPDATELAEWVPKMVDKLRSVPQVRDVAGDLATGGKQVFIDIDRSAAARYGISVADVDAVLYDALGQRQVSTIFTQSNQYRVVLEVEPAAKRGIQDLGSLHVPSPTGKQVRLSNLASFHEQPAQLAVTRQGQFPAARVSFNLAPGSALGDAVAAITRAQKELAPPASLVASFQGSAGAFETALDNQLFLILAAVVTMYIVLGVLYESFIHPVTILSTLPSAGVGALLALMMAKSDLNVIGIIGIILLIGIVKKNAIMMIDFALEAQREGGMPPEKAIHQACLLRFRPILMTTMAALLGALPLMLGTGMGSELRRPLGITMVGGLIVSQMLTLFTTPVIYLWFDRLGRRFGQARAAAVDAGNPQETHP